MPKHEIYKYMGIILGIIGIQAMEQFTATSQRCRLTIQSIPAVTKDTIFVWIVGPRRSVNYFNCAI